MKAMKDNGNKILNDVKEALQEDDNKKFDALCGKLPSRLADVFGNGDVGGEQFRNFTEEYFRFIDYINLPAVGAPYSNFETNRRRLERVFAVAGKLLARPVKEDDFDYHEIKAPRNRRASVIFKRLFVVGMAIGARQLLA